MTPENRRPLKLIDRAPIENAELEGQLGREAVLRRWLRSAEVDGTDEAVADAVLHEYMQLVECGQLGFEPVYD